MEVLPDLQEALHLPEEAKEVDHDQVPVLNQIDKNWKSKKNFPLVTTGSPSLSKDEARKIQASRKQRNYEPCSERAGLSLSTQ